MYIYMTPELILMIVSLSFNVIERLFKYSKKHAKLKSECCGADGMKFEYEVDKINNKK